MVIQSLHSYSICSLTKPFKLNPILNEGLQKCLINMTSKPLKFSTKCVFIKVFILKTEGVIVEKPNAFFFFFNFVARILALRNKEIKMELHSSDIWHVAKVVF